MSGDCWRLLPSELKRLVLEQLTLAELARCRGVSQSWKAETAPLHALTEAAFRAGIVPPRTAVWAELAAADGEQCAMLLGLASVHGHYKGLANFAALCARQRDIAAGWGTMASDEPHPVLSCLVPGINAGRAYAAITSLRSPWRMKLDHVEGTIICSDASEGVLRVLSVPPLKDLPGPAVNLRAELGVDLWHTAASAYTHVEADQGYVVLFEHAAADASLFGHFQVWSSERILGAAELGRPPVRGAHKLTGTIPVPASLDTGNGIAFKLNYPTLAVSTSSKCAVLFDLRDPRGAVVAQAGTENPGEENFTSYIEHTPEYVFLTAARGLQHSELSEPYRTLPVSGLVVIRRSDNAFWDMGKEHFGTTVPWSQVTLRRAWRIRSRGSGLAYWAKLSLDAPELVTEDNVEELLWRSYHAVHLDTRTGTLVALTDDSLVLIGNYEALMSDPSQATYTVVQLFEDHEEVHPRGSLAVRDGRAICHFGIRGTPLYLVDLDAGRLEAGWHPSVAREISVACSLTQTNYLSCIQADDASLFVATDFNSDWPGLSTWDFGTVAPAEQPFGKPALPRRFQFFMDSNTEDDDFAFEGEPAEFESHGKQYYDVRRRRERARALGTI